MMKAEEKINQKDSDSNFDKLKSFIDQVTENVIEGASLVTEKIIDTSGKVYEVGVELVEEANDRFHQFTDKKALQAEQRKLKDRQKEIIVQFGAITLDHYLVNESLHKAFLTKKAISSLVDEFKSNSKDLKSLEKKISKL